MAKGRKPSINLKGPAAAYAAACERIAEFSTKAGIGGLISIVEMVDGRCHVQIYRCDSGVIVSTAHDSPDVNDTVDALTQAESFISGFEDDETQEGVGDILAGLRAAIVREQAKPELLSWLKCLAGRMNDMRDELSETEITETDLALAAIARAEGR